VSSAPGCGRLRSRTAYNTLATPPANPYKTSSHPAEFVRLRRVHTASGRSTVAVGAVLASSAVQRRRWSSGSFDGGGSRLPLSISSAPAVQVRACGDRVGAAPHRCSRIRIARRRPVKGGARGEQRAARAGRRDVVVLAFPVQGSLHRTGSKDSCRTYARPVPLLPGPSRPAADGVRSARSGERRVPPTPSLIFIHSQKRRAPVVGV
jgi:hypothetical protein